ncbi:hypothetical protein [uncultured Roseobacter sp.]|uniref:hypothetical protein n=1 Tax=uncultured Roseobacter sp. TaxID=114847 RepID=UPI00263A1F75|nr:hypothetical protein [uncultured Roseobacter sp.]
MDATPHLTALALATLAGSSIPLGAWMATWSINILPDWRATELRHGIIAFGAGALLAAVALVLLPEGAARLSPFASVGWFVLGGLGFAVIDGALARRGSNSAQFLAMMMDYLPEALALGALVTGNLSAAVLVAALIALQNLPESFNAMREMRESGRAASLWLFVLMVPLGPLAAYLGLSIPPSYEPVVGAIMVVASGGIVYLMFQDIAPQIPLEKTILPPLGAVLGFGLGFAGHLMI